MNSLDRSEKMNSLDRSGLSWVITLEAVAPMSACSRGNVCNALAKVVIVPVPFVLCPGGPGRGCYLLTINKIVNSSYNFIGFSFIAICKA